MLQSIHDQAQSWIAWVIVGLLIIPFALWGINSYFEGGGGAVVAEVNGTEIGLRDYQRSLQQQRQQLRSLMGANYRPEMMENPEMRRAVLEAMIENDLLTQAVHADGFRIGDELLLDQIQRIEAFQHDGRFSSEIYEQVLAAQGMSKSFFENSMKTDLMQSQLLTGFRHASFVTPRELQESVRLQNQKRTLRLLTIPATLERIENRVVDDQEIAAQYEVNAVAYEIPEQVTLDYIELSVAELAQEVPVEEADLRKLYEERKEGMVADEERQASHILIELPEGADQQTTDAAQARMKEVQQKLAAGDSFEALAKEYSADPGSAVVGGDLGFFPRGIMVPAFDEAVFGMPVGDTVEVQTEFGLHLIRLEAIQASEIRPYESVREELSAELKRQGAENLFFEHAETIANIAYEEPDSLEGAAAAAGLVVKQSEFFSRQGGEGVAEKPGVIQAAFSDMVLNEGKNSDPVELAEDHVVVLRVRDHKPATRKPLGEVRKEVIDAILVQRARKEARDQGVELLNQLQQGTLAVEGVAKQAEVDWDEARTISRKDLSLPAEVVARAFRINGLKSDQKKYAGTELRGGGYALIELSGVDEGGLQGVESKQREVLRRQIADGQMQSHYQGYLTSLRNGAEIQIYEEQLSE